MLKKLFLIFLALLCAFPVLLVPASAEPSLSAKAAVVLEADRHQLLLAKNEQEQLSMASTTKVMTALLAVESGDLAREITVTEAMINVEGTSLGLKAGDRVSLETLIYGMFMQSGNDAANATAYMLGGSKEGFAKMMNARAREIGMQNTNFVTPSGLDAEGHYTTAYDLALLAATAVKNDVFVSFCSAKSCRVKITDPPAEYAFATHNRILKSYPGAIGIKTGFTKKSGRCLVTAARRDGVTIVAVTLNDPNDWEDHTNMLDYGFAQVQNVTLDSDFSDLSVPLAGGLQDSVSVTPETAPHAALREGEAGRVTRKIQLNRFEYAPVTAGQNMGMARYYIDDTVIFETPLQADRSVERKMMQETDQTEQEKWYEKVLAWIAKRFQKYYNATPPK